MSLSGFVHPWWLLWLIAVALVAAGYIAVQLRRRRKALRFASFDMLDAVAPQRRKWYLHLPAAMLVLGLTGLTIAAAGPTADHKVPRNRATVMLAIDVSLSMEATDVQPSRLEAAQEAAKSFVDELPDGINLGLVSFAGTASVLVSPTTNRQSVVAAIDNLQLAERTATGEAIFTSLQAIENFGAGLGGGDNVPPARIVLESDGTQTVPQGLNDPRGAFTAARQAKKVGVPVSTISFGTSYGYVDIEGQRINVPVDDDSLKQIADLSGGTFFRASSLGELESVYDTLQTQLGFEIERGDASRPWLLLGSALVLAAAAGSLVVGRRLP
ncbi:VWA domain-containing protein [Tomitella cavernea]|uniref:VWA domain-containing protein n=1 Tax=Tomitella cavernea TaxID=1387982 RepID=A0ABP9CNC3_9ACTN|nr:VWA domain-containing protein [Tomitella cavernea]